MPHQSEKIFRGCDVSELVIYLERTDLPTPPSDPTSPPTAVRADPALRHRPQPGIWQKQKSNFEKLKNNWRPSRPRPEISSRSDARDGPRSPRRCHRAATVAAVPPLCCMRAVPSHDHHRCAPLPHTACPAAAVMFCATTEWRAITSTSATRAAASAHAAAAACAAASTRALAPPPTRPPTRATTPGLPLLVCSQAPP